MHNLGLALGGNPYRLQYSRPVLYNILVTEITLVTVTVSFCLTISVII